MKPREKRIRRRPIKKKLKTRSDTKYKHRSNQTSNWPGDIQVAKRLRETHQASQTGVAKQVSQRSNIQLSKKRPVGANVQYRNGYRSNQTSNLSKLLSIEASRRVQAIRGIEAALYSRSEYKHPSERRSA